MSFYAQGSIFLHVCRSPCLLLWGTTWVKNRAPVRIKPASLVSPAADAYQDSTRMAGFRSSAYVVNSDVRVGGITVQNVLDIDATSGRFPVGISWFPSRW